MGRVKLADLTPEEYASVMEEAKHQLAEESKIATATSIYRVKKRELLHDITDAIAEDLYRKIRFIPPTILSLDGYREYHNFKPQVYKAFVSCVNFCMKFYMAGPTDANAPAITTEIEWQYFKAMCEEVDDAFRRWMTGDGMSHDLMEKAMEQTTPYTENGIKEVGENNEGSQYP